MKNIFAIFIAFCVGLTSCGAMAALKVSNASSSAGAKVGASGVQVKKASLVQKQEQTGVESMLSGSLLPGVIGLVGNVAVLAKQQKDLEAECIPTSSDISFVKDLVKEWAKTGVKADSMVSSGEACDADRESYSDSVSANLPYKQTACFADVFDSKGENENAVWIGFPIPATATYYPDGCVSDCSPSKKKTVSNVYDIFDKIGFDEEDLTTAEASKYEKFREKVEKCSSAKIKSRKKEAYVGFVQNAISGAGQKTGTANVWDAVGSLSQSGGGLSGGVQSLMPAVTQFLDK